MLVSTSIFATPEDAAQIFKPELRKDAVAYIKAENADRKELHLKFVSLLNKEFGKEIVYLEVLKSVFFSIANEPELTPEEREKLKKIIIALTPEVTQKRTGGPVGDIELAFDL